ncbi:MAG: tetratricopeptide repeat protein [candidate division KSB1 bacterium]|nr:tetratricopeptide repeat protein [candidate division KSB1 bacterium]
MFISPNHKPVLLFIFSFNIALSINLRAETSPSAVGVATGGSASLFLTDAASLFWNPAASAVNRYSQIAASFCEPYTLNYWAATAFLPPSGTFGVWYFSAESIPNPKKQLGVSLARSLSYGLFLGGSLAAVRQSKDESIEGRIGILYSLQPATRPTPYSIFYRFFLHRILFGASYFSRKNAEELGAGVAYRTPYEKITLFYSRRWQNDRNSNHIGFSWEMRRFLTAYAGLETGQGNINYGLSWRKDPLVIEVAFDSRAQRLMVSGSLRIGDEPTTAAERHYHRAKEALRLRHRTEALQQARKALYYDKDHLYARALYEGVELLVKEDERLIDSLSSLALQRLAEKRTLEAAFLLTEAAKINPLHPKLRKHLAALSAAAKPEIETWVRRAVELYDSSDSEARRIFEAVQLLDPKQQLVKDYLQRFREKDAEEAERHYLAGLEYLSRKELYAAEEEFLTTVKIQPTHSEAFEQLSNVRLQKKLNRRTVSALLDEAAEKESRGDWKGALSAYQQVSALEKDHPIAAEKADEIQRMVEEQIEDHLQRGESALQKGDSLEARTAFETVLTYDPNHVKARNFLARLNAPTSDRGQSLLRQAQAAFAAKKFEIAVILADSLQRTGLRPKETAILLERIRRQVDAETLLSNARRKLQQHDLLAALQSAQAARILNPDAAAEEVIKSCRNALRRDVDEFFNRGMTYYTAGDYLEAIKWWNEVLRLNPDHKGAREYRARATERLEALESIR